MFRTYRSVAAPGEAVATEKLERMPNASRSRMLENLWVAAGVSGWVLSGWVLFRLYTTWPQPDWVIAGGLMVAAFFAVAGLYALLSFGLDEWRDGAERSAMTAMLLDRDEEIAELTRKLAAAYEGWENAQRPIIVSTPNNPVSAVPEVIGHVRKILFRRNQNLAYSRAAMCDDFHVLTQMEWTAAFQLLSSTKPEPAARKAGKGDRRGDGSACKAGEWLLTDAPDARVIADCMLALGLTPPPPN